LINANPTKMGVNSCTPEVYTAHAPLVASTRTTRRVTQSQVR